MPEIINLKIIIPLVSNPIWESKGCFFYESIQIRRTLGSTFKQNKAEPLGAAQKHEAVQRQIVSIRSIHHQEWQRPWKLLQTGGTFDAKLNLTSWVTL